jgi:hypothetical protein
MPAQPSRHSTLSWRKSSASGGGNECVEIACRGSSVLVRDSRDPSGPVLAFTPTQWSAFVGHLQGEAQHPSAG